MSDLKMSGGCELYYVKIVGKCLRLSGDLVELGNEGIAEMIDTEMQVCGYIYKQDGLTYWQPMQLSQEWGGMVFL